LPSEEELASGNIEAFRPEPEQQEDDNEQPVVEEVENTGDEENTENNEGEDGGGEARSKTKSGSGKKTGSKGLFFLTIINFNGALY
jgi:hypothetical protein